jgi:hypothetical protein
MTNLYSSQGGSFDMNDMPMPDVLFSDLSTKTILISMTR